MNTTKKRPARELLSQLEEYVGRSPTRKKAYMALAEKEGISADALRMAAKRGGVIDKEHNLRHMFSKEEEESLVLTCLLYARQYTPLTISAFANLATIFAGKPPGKKISRHFVKDFVDRHTDTLRMSKGKITSSKRNFEEMKQNTIEFIESIYECMGGNRMNKNNIVVFDEIIVGDGVYVPLVIGERRDSGGGNINTLATRERALGCYIPFSMTDGSTPFRVFIFKADKSDTCDCPVAAVEQIEEEETCDTPHRLFLVSEKGYLTIELFAYIMKEFADWWKEHHPDLHCFLISDNLRAHTNNDIVATALRSGIHMLNIMPGSSHWFQVHDQLPFANLKKNMNQKKFDLMSDISLTPKQKRVLLMGIFYEAEKKAFDPKILIKSFEKVGLWPWNPKKILKICEEHSPAVVQPENSEMVNRITEAIRISRQSREAMRIQILNKLKPVRVIVIQKSEKSKCHRKDDGKNPEEQEKTKHTRIMRKKKHICVKPLTRHLRISPSCPKRCCAKGCQKTHFWSKKWVFCRKCNKNYCPTHSHLLEHHKCK